MANGPKGRSPRICLCATLAPDPRKMQILEMTRFINLTKFTILDFIEKMLKKIARNSVKTENYA